MPQTTIPLVGNFTQRPHQSSGSNKNKDQLYINCLFDVDVDSARNEKRVWAYKRKGIGSGTSTSSGLPGKWICPLSDTFSAFGSTATKIYKNTTLLSTIAAPASTPKPSAIILRSGESFIMLAAADDNSYYLPTDAAGLTNLTFTGDVSSGNPVISNITNSGRIYIGQLVTGTGFSGGARIISRSPDTTSPTSVTLDSNSSATDTAQTYTRDPLAKIVDSDYPNVYAFVDIDGYLVGGSGNGRVYNSDLNSITSWGASNYLTLPTILSSPFCVKHKDFVVAFGTNGIYYLRNAGNALGSPFSIVDELTVKGYSKWGDAISVGDYVYFENSDRNIYRLSGNQVTNITPDGVLQQNNISRELSIYREFRKEFLLITPGASYFTTDYAYLYDPDTGLISAIVGANGELLKGSVNDTVIANNFYLIDIRNTSTSGKYFYVTTSSGNDYQDNGTNLTMTLQTLPHVLNGGKPFTIKSVELLADTQTSGSTAFSTSGDDYANFATRNAFDLTKSRKVSRRCGYYKSHVIFKLEDSGNQPWRGQALIVDWEPAGG